MHLGHTFIHTHKANIYICRFIHTHKANIRMDIIHTHKANIHMQVTAETVVPTWCDYAVFEEKQGNKDRAVVGFILIMIV